MNKLISIILPTYNGSNRIKDAIKSILTQSYTYWELLVIDDGSVDNIAQIVMDIVQKDPRIIHIKNENNLGIQKTLNRGLKEAKGEYIARIDDDDEWIDKEKLKKQIEFLEENKDYVLVGSGVIVVDDKAKELFRYLSPETDQEIRNKILRKNCFSHSSVMYRKYSAMQFGGYSESYETKHLEDYDLWLKLGTVGKFYNFPDHMIKFSLREDGLSSKNKMEQFKKDINLIKIYKNKYPNYFKSYVLNYLRLFVYKIFISILSKKSRNLMIKIYKED